MDIYIQAKATGLCRTVLCTGGILEREPTWPTEVVDDSRFPSEPMQSEDSG
jgi:hypothetical protein